VGAWGEQAAAYYLAEHGYEIAARNVRTPYGEIDLIARKDGITIFVEVKARTSRSLGPPEIAVTPRKQAHMLDCAGHYAQQHGIDHWQIDVIAVQELDHETEIAHFENAVS
jgi:putative endonuclease